MAQGQAGGSSSSLALRRFRSSSSAPARRHRSRRRGCSGCGGDHESAVPRCRLDRTPAPQLAEVAPARRRLAGSDEDRAVRTRAGRTRRGTSQGRSRSRPGPRRSGNAEISGWAHGMRAWFALTTGDCRGILAASRAGTEPAPPHGVAGRLAARQEDSGSGRRGRSPGAGHEFATAVGTRGLHGITAGHAEGALVRADAGGWGVQRQHRPFAPFAAVPHLQSHESPSWCGHRLPE